MTGNTNWLCVYSSKQIYQVEIVKSILFDHNINSVIVNMQDSAYLFSEIELNVHPDDIIKAKQIINQNQL